MDETTKIEFDRLIERIQDYSNGMLHQDRPEIIWLDHVDSEISRLDTEINGEILGPPDGVTLGALLAKMNDRITFWDKAGSPLTGHKRRFDRDGQVLRITEDERYGLNIPESIRINDNGTLYTRMLIHSPFSCFIGENGLTSLEYGVMLKEELGIAVVILYPYEWKERIEKLGSIASYKQLLCQQTKEKDLDNWLSLFEEKKLVCSFYLDFIKAVPVVYSPYFGPFRWIQVTDMLYSDLETTMQLLFKSIQSKEDRVRAKSYLPIINNNIIDFEKVNQILDLVSDEIWQKWLEGPSSLYYRSMVKDYPSLEFKKSRVEILKIDFCGLASYRGIPSDVIKALLAFHHLI